MVYRLKSDSTFYDVKDPSGVRTHYHEGDIFILYNEDNEGIESAYKADGYTLFRALKDNKIIPFKCIGYPKWCFDKV